MVFVVAGCSASSRSASKRHATATTTAATAPTSAGRRTIAFNDGWRFAKGDRGDAMMVPFDDSGWRKLDLPHDWSIEGPFSSEFGSGNGFAPGGIAWYRKRFTLDGADKGKRVVIEFDGVYDHSTVYINGFVVGGRPYGYSSFECDLTRHLKFAGDVNPRASGGGGGGGGSGGAAGENVIAVRVDHSRYADSRWYTGSGIYRNVRLRLTDELHVAPHGLYVTTPQVSDAAATVNVEATVQNESARARRFTVRSDVLDAGGNVVGSARATGEAAAGQSKAVTRKIRIDRPRRWSMQSPALYTLRTRVSDGDRVVDETSTTFGVRTIRFDADKGFFLNDVPTKLKGVCIHHDAGGLGAAVPEQVLERRLRLLMELGTNAIRTSHNPPAPELLDLCDRLGLVVMDEAFDEFTPAKNKWIAGHNAGVPGHWGYADDFSEWAVRDVSDMVRRDRNHPSIIMWSIGNEVDYANDPFSHPVLGASYRPQNPPAEDLVRLGKPLVEAVKALDRTRPVTAALANAPMSNAVGFADVLDVAGYNYQESLYAADHAKYPKRVIYGSENGDRYADWLAVRDNEYISGQFLWTGIDYLGEAGGWPIRGNWSGLLDTCGFKKPIAWVRQSLWTEQPMVYLCTTPGGGGRGGGGGGGGGNAANPGSTVAASAAGSASGTTGAAATGTSDPATTGATTARATTRRTTRPATGATGGNRRGRGNEESWNRPPGSTATVVCYTNCEEVRLTLNDRPVGTQRAADAVEGALTWTVPFEPGVLKAVGYRNGRSASEFVLRTAGPAARIELASDVSTLRPGRKDIAHLAFRITDAAGVRVPDASHVVRFRVTGPGKLLAIDNGEMAGQSNYAGPEQAAFLGRGLAIVQSTGESGTVTVEASSPGLEPAKVELSSR